MMQRRKILLSFAPPVLIGVFFLLSLVSTCERFQELELEVTTSESVIFLPDRAYKITGAIESFGRKPVTQHGFCWAETPEPKENGNATQLGSKNTKGNFTSTITDLPASTLFYVRAYAISGEGTTYGDERTFTTPAPSLSVLTTTSISNITETSAQGGGNVTSDGGATVTARGVCWSESSNPTISNSKTTDGSGTGSYTSSITGLNCGTLYYVRAYATNSSGTSYGSQVSFTTSQCPASSPTVTTTSISNITETSAIGGGNVTSDGGAEVTAFGVCWSTSESPTLSDEFTTDGSGTGIFTSSLAGLDCNTTYYVKAYATNSAGTAYGNQVEFTASQCPVVLPKVTTTFVYIVSETSAQSGGNVTNEGSATVIEKGVCWSTTPEPTIDNNRTSDGNGIGNFSSQISGLSPYTTYYIRAYATNSVGTGYGEQDTIKTLWDNSTTVSDYDGNEYNTIQIGQQVWMKENLKVTSFPDGSPIPLVESDTAWAALIVTSKAYCWYDNSITNREDYGALYTWAAAMNGAPSSSTNPSYVQGACPAGWHLPSDAEWTELADYLGGRFVAGDKLKEAGTLHWIEPISNASNESGFTAIPGGARSNIGTFRGKGEYSNFWTATEFDTALPWYRCLTHDKSDIMRETYTWDDVARSVRCVKN